VRAETPRLAPPQFSTDGPGERGSDAREKELGIQDLRSSVRKRPRGSALHGEDFTEFSSPLLAALAQGNATEKLPSGKVVANATLHLMAKGDRQFGRYPTLEQWLGV
jgi:hypothetical protein